MLNSHRLSDVWLFFYLLFSWVIPQIRHSIVAEAWLMQSLFIVLQQHCIIGLSSYPVQVQSLLRFQMIERVRTLWEKSGSHRTVVVQRRSLLVCEFTTCLLMSQDKAHTRSFCQSLNELPFNLAVQSVQW